MSKSVYLGLSILDLCKTVCMSFGIIKQDQNMVKMQNIVIWIQISSLFM